MTPARHRQALLPSGSTIDQRPQQRKLVGKIFEYALEVPLQPDSARPRLGVARSAPRAASDEVVLADREACREIGSLDQSTDVRARRGRETEPIPPTLDDLAECADSDSLAIGRQERVSFDEARCRGRAAAAEPD